jgi:hypothetical protein
MGLLVQFVLEDTTATQYETEKMPARNVSVPKMVLAWKRTEMFIARSVQKAIQASYASTVLKIITEIPLMD